VGLVLWGALLFACASTPEAKTVLSLRDVDCQSCGIRAARALEDQAGVEQASFDKQNVEIAVAYDPAQTTPAALVAAVQRETGFAVVVGSGKGRYTADVSFPPELDVRWISKEGEGVDIESHRAAGKVTVFDFGARWCGPCKDLDREMRSILEASPDVALRKLNVVDWDSEVAARYLGGVPELPYVLVYSKSGKRVDAISGLDLARLRRAIESARR
jgi:thiol-disulfide isomerase/thioredoxin